jgi:hypothetical protein
MGMTVIWDNVTFHRAASPWGSKLSKLRRSLRMSAVSLSSCPLIHQTSIQLKKYWAKLKADIRRIRVPQMTIPQALSSIFQKAL